MRADRSPFLPLQLPLESDCEPGEVAPARAPRAPHAQRARAAAAARCRRLRRRWLCWLWLGARGPPRGPRLLPRLRLSLLRPPARMPTSQRILTRATRARRPGRLAQFPSAALSQARSCYKKNDYWSSCNQTCNPYYMWKDGGWVETNETVWDCEEVRPPCSQAGESCALTQCCSEPGASCYKKNDYWFACNLTCDPNSMWMEDRWVKTNETVWDCGVIAIESTDNATDAADTDAPADSASSSDASTASACSQNGESCAQTMCCSEPGAKCYKKNDHWSSCNQTCDPFSLWEVDRWVVTNETVWDCEEVRPPCTPNGASCALSQCCSEPGAKCYKKNDYWSSCNQTCNPDYLWMETGWVKTNETVWDCEDLTVSPVESADPIADAEAEDQNNTCSQNGASCALSQCCAEPGSKLLQEKWQLEFVQPILRPKLHVAGGPLGHDGRGSLGLRGNQSPVLA
ncbi:unnamed protein product [Prorocentrum cordatum]|uniref:Cellulase n=1 Tax=Prorocentrum cordatum TaxID=2364126 RepID=A0ABN9QJK4_9DINO|nr:unnamed protein product [Polarella glacialis]